MKNAGDLIPSGSRGMRKNSADSILSSSEDEEDESDGNSLIPESPHEGSINVDDSSLDLAPKVPGQKTADKIPEISKASATVHTTKPRAQLQRLLQ